MIIERLRFYSGIALVSAAALVFQILIPRVLSVITWYHLAFFAISIAMFGMTSGALAVFFRQKPNQESADDGVARAALMFGASLPLGFVACLFIRIESNVSQMWSVGALLPLVLFALCLAVPFFFAGVTITLALTNTAFPIGRVYAADLGGAGAGCLAAIPIMNALDPATASFSIGALACFAARLLVHSRRNKKLRKASLLLGLTLGVIAAFSIATGIHFRPYWVKGRRDSMDSVLLERWNTFSRIRVSKETVGPPKMWSASVAMPSTRIAQHNINIDGVADTPLYYFDGDLEPLSFLKYDITSLAYFLKPRGPAVIIGAGGGRDALTALLFGNRPVDAVEINPIIVQLLKGRFSKFNRLSTYEGITLHNDEGRSFLSASKSTYSLIQMSLIDTWASTGAGAMSLSENGLYTVEAWQLFLSRLRPDGVLTVSRWFAPGHADETSRMISVSLAALFRLGAKQPQEHILLAGYNGLATLILFREPASNHDRDLFDNVCRRLGFDVLISPGRHPGTPLLQALLSARTEQELEERALREPVNVAAATDNEPFFFNMVRFTDLLRPQEFLKWGLGVMPGNLAANTTLAVSLGVATTLSIATLLLPLIFGRRKRQESLPRYHIGAAAVYFGAIGLGFMFIEISLLQRMSVYLGHPSYSLAIVLFALITSTGIGSYLSELISLTSRLVRLAYPVLITTCIGLGGATASSIIIRTHGLSLWQRCLLAVACICPMGIALGTCFPLGVRLIRRTSEELVPWLWAINGATSVIASVLSIILSMSFGIRATFCVALGLYLVLLPCLMLLRSSRPGMCSGK